MRARWSDAWVLAAVDWAADADLAKIIQAADAINHAIPTIDEVEHAIRFLGAAGLVRYSDNSLQLTGEGKRVCRRTESQDILSTLDRLHRLLKTLPEIAEAPKAETVLDRSTYLSALERYGTLMAEELPELYDRGTSSAIETVTTVPRRSLTAMRADQLERRLRGALGCPRPSTPRRAAPSRDAPRRGRVRRGLPGGVSSTG